LRILLTAAALALLGACSSMEGVLEGTKVDYKSAGKLPPLDVPPDLTAPSRDNRYAVPDSGKPATTLSGYQAERAQSRPGAGTVLPTAEGVRVERDGNQRWLVVSEPPEKLWPQVREFWQESGFLLRQEVPEAGIMETDWAENRAKIPESWLRRTLGGIFEDMHSTSERDKYRTRLERTPTGGTEIYISHRGMMELYVSEERSLTRWQPRPPEPELEAEFLRRLLVRLGTPEEKAKALLAAAAPPAQRAAMRKGLDGQELLEVFEPFDRAWRRIGLALDRVGFTVQDRDRQKGLFFVRYADPEAEMDRKSREQGAFSWLAFWRSDGPKVKAEQYRVAVSAESDNSRVQILDTNGTAESSATSRRILALLHEQLK
jgi:outer membrane protein assembly factor BamC